VAILFANSLLNMAHAEDDGAEYRRILAAAKNAKLTLVDAIKKAETRLKGVAIEAGMEAEEGLEIFVVVVNQEGVWEVVYDARKGRLEAIHRAEDDDEDDEDDDDDDEVRDDD
jgi:hypothetical protein